MPGKTVKYLLVKKQRKNSKFKIVTWLISEIQASYNLRKREIPICI